MCRSGCKPPCIRTPVPPRSSISSNFFVDGLERQDVAVLRAERPVERAERTVFRAEIRVVDVAVDLVCRHARVRLLPPHFVRSHADADQIVGVEKIECFLLSQPHLHFPFATTAIKSSKPDCVSLRFLRAAPRRKRPRIPHAEAPLSAAPGAPPPRYPDRA